jgi:hypothetical protein
VRDILRTFRERAKASIGSLFVTEADLGWRALGDNHALKRTLRQIKRFNAQSKIDTALVVDCFFEANDDPFACYANRINLTRQLEG